MTERVRQKMEIKKELLEQLKEENVFWSYDNSEISADTLSDDELIAQTMRHLDLPDIGKLFAIFPFNKIKEVWKRMLVPEGDYIYTMNRFFAWYYFKAKRPDAYLKSLTTRHINALLQ